MFVKLYFLFFAIKTFKTIDMFKKVGKGHNLEHLVELRYEDIWCFCFKFLSIQRSFKLEFVCWSYFGCYFTVDYFVFHEWMKKLVLPVFSEDIVLSTNALWGSMCGQLSFA